MRLRATAVAAVVFLCAAISISAQTAVPPKVSFPVYGAGTQSCGAWLVNPHGDLRRSHMLSWVLGWVSASTYFTEAVGAHMRHTDANAVEAWVDKYCRENPLKDVSYASGELVAELLKPE